METKKLHYLIAFLSFPITVLHFIFGDYTTEKFVSGITFYVIATAMYLSFVYLFNKNEVGKKVVLWGLVFIAIASILMFLKYSK
ncbi:hypothetical protein [Bacillus sp. Marseille-Q3570]|uniref:hypothetical protein n=1 Tax=Bacillus sp. Marseille-Q3570 TaxID=2963522 RepID=UPI0021B71D29|nr:hypothetical protein [Bacillus sp. Marseille-Q3570]